MSDFRRGFWSWLIGHSRNNYVLAISILALVLSIGWGVSDGGWEPWIVALLGFGAIVSNYESKSNEIEISRRLSPQQRLAARDKWRPQFEEYFLKNASQGYRGDAIIHDVNRLDNYPVAEKGESGISPWFRVGLMGTSNDGVLLGLRWTYLTQKGGRLVETECKESGDELKAILLGELPYESIESVNFDGDRYYNKPHIFCYFEYDEEPYRQLYYGEEFRLFEGAPWHYREIAEYERPKGEVE